MSGEIATLGIAVDSSPVTDASAALDRLTESAAGAAKAVKDLESAALAIPKALNDNVRVLQSATAAHGAHANALGMSNYRTMSLIRATTQLGYGLSYGTTALRMMGIEALHAGLIMGEGPGGLGGLIGRLTSAAGRFATSWLGAGTGVAAGVAIAVTSLVSFQRAQDRLAASLSGIGRASGLSLAGLNAVAQRGAAAGGLSITEAGSLAAGYVGTGQIGGTLAEQLIAETRKYGAVTGVGTEAAGKSLAGMAAEPVKGLEELSRVFGDVDDRTMQLARSQMAMGDRLGAQQTFTDALSKSMDAATDNTWKLSAGVEALKNKSLDAWTNLGRFTLGLVATPPLAERIKALQDQAKALNPDAEISGAGVVGGRPGYSSGIATMAEAKSAKETQEAFYNIIKQLAPLLREQAVVNESTIKAQKEIESNRLGASATDIVRQTLPIINQHVTTAGNLKILSDAMANSDALKGMDPAARAAIGEAQSNIATKAAFNDPFVRMADDVRLATDTVNAFSIAETASVAARRAELEIMRSSGDVMLASVAAENARNEAITNVNKEAGDLLTKAKQEQQMIGMTPIQRAHQELINQYKPAGGGGLIDKYTATKEDWKTAWQPVIADLGRGGAAGALFDSAAALSNAALRSSGGSSVRSLYSESASPYGAVGAPAVPASLAPIFTKASALSGIPVAVLEAQAKQESNFNPTAGNWSGDYGIMQIRPSTANNPGFDVSSLPLSDRSDPNLAIPWAAQYEAARARSLGLNPSNPSDIAAILKAYNGGGDKNYPANVMRWMPQGFSPTPAMGTQPNIPVTAGASVQSAYDIKSSNIDQNAATNAFIGAQQSIADTQRQTVLLNAEFGKSTSEIAGLAAAEKLRTQYVQEFGDAATWTNPLAKTLNDNIKAIGDSATVAAKSLADAQKKQQEVIGALDTARSDTTDIMTSVIDAAVTGKNVSKAFRGTMEQIGLKTLNSGIGQVTDLMFGKQGSSGGGLFGGGIGGLIGSMLGINPTSSMPTPTAGIGGIGMAADGGVMTSRGFAPLRRYSDGGVASSPQLAMFGEGSGPEAYIPLKNGGVPVKMQGGGKSSGAPTIHMGDTNVVVHGNLDNVSTGQMVSAIAEANAKSMRLLQRNFSPFGSHGNSRYLDA